jgi:hypothetical protein
MDYAWLTGKLDEWISEKIERERKKLDDIISRQRAEIEYPEIEYPEITVEPDGPVEPVERDGPVEPVERETGTSS